MSFNKVKSNRGSLRFSFRRFGLFGLLGFALVSCENKDEIDRLNAEIEVHNNKLEDVESRLVREEAILNRYRCWKEQMEINKSVAEKVAAAAERLVEEKAKTKELQDAHALAANNFYEYLAEYRKAERTAAEGTMIDLSSIRGDDYKSVKISRITPMELRVLLSTGPKGIPYTELPEEVRERFQFSDEEAQAYQLSLAQVQKEQTNLNQPLVADTVEDKADDRASEVGGLVAVKRQEIDSLKRRIDAKQLEAEGLEQKSRDLRNKGNTSIAEKYSEQANAIRLQITEAKEMIETLRVEVFELVKKS